MIREWKLEATKELDLVRLIINDGRPSSPSSSCVSLKSDQSKDVPLNFRNEDTPTQERRPSSPSSSCVSLKSDQSKDVPLNFRNEDPPTQERRPSSPSSSCVSLKSDQSKDVPLNFRNEDPPTQERGSSEKLESNVQNFTDQQSFKKTPDLCRIFSDLESKIVVFIKHELERFRKILTKENTRYYEKLTDDWCSAKEGALNLALHFLKKMKHDSIADALEMNELIVIQEELEVFDLKKFIRSDECLKKLLPVVETAKIALLNDCELTETSYSALVKPLSSESSKLIELDLSNNDLLDSGLKLLSAGLSCEICKLEELRINNCGLTEASCEVMATIFSSEHSTLKSLELSKNKLQDSGVQLLSAGLEKPQVKLESLRLCDCSITEQGCAALASALKLNSSPLLTELDLSENEIGDAGVEKLSDILNSYKCKLEKLTLSKCCITEKGYAALASALKSKRYSRRMDLDLRENDPGDRGVQMIRDPCCKLKTLRLLKSADAEAAHKFLTESVGTDPLLQRKLDLSGKTLGGSGVKQLSALLADSHCRLLELRLNKSGINEEGCAALVSALCLNPSHLGTLELSGNTVGKSGAEKLGALLENPSCQLLKLGLSNCSITDEGCSAVASAVEKNPEHLKELDVSGNKIEGSGLAQLSALLKNPNCIVDTLRLSYCHITGEGYAALAAALKSNPSSHLTELHLRGNEPGDTGVELLTDLLEDPTCKLKTLRLLKSAEAEDACSSLTRVLKKNPLLQTELDLTGKIQGDTQVRQMSLLLEDSHCRLQKLGLSDCRMTEKGYAALAAALKSNPSSHLTELDLRGNDPGGTGVELLTDLLEDPTCKLKTLRLLKSDDAVEAHAFLSQALKKEPLLLTELNLSKTNLGPTELKRLSALLLDSHCKLKTLRLSKCDVTEKSCEYLAKVLSSEDSKLTELDLSNNGLGDSGVKKLCPALKNSHCKLETLRLSDCSIGEEGYAALASALKSTPSSLLKELDLRGNDPGDTGVELISSTSSRFKPRKIRLLKNHAAHEARDSLTKAFRKDPLLLSEMDLKTYKPKHVGVKQICGVLEDSHCRLKTLKLYKSGSITEGDCAALVSALTVNPSHLRELDLNENKLDKSGVQKLCDLLRSPHCKLKILTLNNNTITSKDCADLASAVSSNLSHLRELDLSANEIQDSGLKHFCDVLKSQECKLEKLLLKDCGIKGGGCAALAAALKSNSSHLKVLDLRGNSLGSSVNDLAEVLKDSGCDIQLDGAIKTFFKTFTAPLSWSFFGGKEKEDVGIHCLVSYSNSNPPTAMNVHYSHDGQDHGPPTSVRVSLVILRSLCDLLQRCTDSLSQPSGFAATTLYEYRSVGSVTGLVGPWQLLSILAHTR
ncbi:hypothetical protein AOLI_G00202430 [Acnodon oligacanthus]